MLRLKASWARQPFIQIFNVVLSMSFVLRAMGLTGWLVMFGATAQAQTLPPAEINREAHDSAHSETSSEVSVNDALPEANVLAPVVIESSAEPSSATGLGQSSCEAAALERQPLHVVAQGESLAAIAQRYSVTVATLKGLNPVVREAGAIEGQALQIPPYDGAKVRTEGQSWTALGDRYAVSAAVLFEQNGCAEPGLTAFIPGLEWSEMQELETQKHVATAQMQPPQPMATGAAEQQMAAGAAVESRRRSLLNGYPLVESAVSLVDYGWQVAGTLKQAKFHSGVDLSAAVGDGVFAIGSGTVAYAGEQQGYGNLVVVNHAQGLQTRYAHLNEIAVTQGQVIESDAMLGTVGQTGAPSAANAHLHFEVRLNSQVGWVAQDPSAYLGEQVEQVGVEASSNRLL